MRLIVADSTDGTGRPASGGWTSDRWGAGLADTCLMTDDQKRAGRLPIGVDG